MDALAFRHYEASLFDACLDLFDSNCPAYFAPNEREDYVRFLRGSPGAYRVGFLGEKPVAAFGLRLEAPGDRASVNWIMVCPSSSGQGIGDAMMRRALEMALDINARVIDIAASHLSAPFFARYGALEVGRETDGWGEGMHRVDMELQIAGQGDERDAVKA